jgi:hypothetical protein
MLNNDSNKVPSKISRGGSQGEFIGILHTVALIALVVGIIGSLIFMFRAGQHTPRLLLVIFTIWVLSPFAALIWADKASKRWSALTRITLYCVTLIVTLGSLAIYSELVDVRPAGSANAFLFVIVPPVSLVFIMIVVPIAALISGMLSRPGDGN